MSEHEFSSSNQAQTLVETFLTSPSQAASIFRSVVLEALEDGSVSVVAPDGQRGPVHCDVMHSSDGSSVALARGDAVLVWIATPEDGRGVILGRIGPSHNPAAYADLDDDDQTPDELIIEAKKNLTLKCGDGSITLRGDGKVLIKGKDLVSRAQRTNRIKGGSVAIN